MNVPRASPVAVHQRPLPELPATPASNAPVLLYDGECGLCARSVQFVLAHETARTAYRLRFAPLQGEFGRTIGERFPEVATADSVVWFEPLKRRASRPLLRSDAALSVLSYLGGVWRVLAMLGRAVPRPLRDGVYRAIATKRHLLTARACLLPRADERVRFLP